MQDKYISHLSGETAAVWDAMRKEVVKTALEQHLYPLLAKQALERKKKDALYSLRAQVMGGLAGGCVCGCLCVCACACVCVCVAGGWAGGLAWARVGNQDTNVAGAGLE